MVINEIYHHGIQGQKWGVRNGPPYPLDAVGLYEKDIKSIDIVEGDTVLSRKEA